MPTVSTTSSRSETQKKNINTIQANSYLLIVCIFQPWQQTLSFFFKIHKNFQYCLLSFSLSLQALTLLLTLSEELVTNCCGLTIPITRRGSDLVLNTSILGFSKSELTSIAIIPLVLVQISTTALLMKKIFKMEKH